MCLNYKVLQTPSPTALDPPSDSKEQHTDAIEHMLAFHHLCNQFNSNVRCWVDTVTDMMFVFHAEIPQTPSVL